MIRILCFGDSNTWGYDPATFLRFPRKARWAGVLRDKLGDGYEVIEEGLNGRTTVWDDPVEGQHKNGLPYLKACLESHAPLDLVIIMLGTNDLKQRYSLPASDIAEGASVLASWAQNSQTGRDQKAPQVLLVSPVEVSDAIALPPLCDGRLGLMFGADSPSRSRQFKTWYRTVADTLGCSYLDAARFAEPSPLDAVHLDAEGHRTLGLAIAQAVADMKFDYGE